NRSCCTFRAEPRRSGHSRHQKIPSLLIRQQQQIPTIAFPRFHCCNGCSRRVNRISARSSRNDDRSLCTSIQKSASVSSKILVTGRCFIHPVGNEDIRIFRILPVTV